MTRATLLWRCRSGASAAEFALVLPLLLILMFGVIDGGRFLWEYNRAEKATQVGARVAAVTDLVAGGLADYSFAVEDSIPAGEAVPVGNFDKVVCDDVGCTCTGGDVCSGITHDPAAHTAIVDRMTDMYPNIAPENVEITYRNVGLGYSGDPVGPDVAPLITVELEGMNFAPLTTMIFGTTFPMPGFRASLTAEDSSGTQSN
ncbi:MAG: TadE family protein [Sphingomicrobium sp.]